MGRKIDKQIVYEYLAAIPRGKVVTYSQIGAFWEIKTWRAASEIFCISIRTAINIPATRS